MAISIAIMERGMEKQVSIAEAKDQFSAVVQAAERGAVVCITRRGHAVARVLSEEEYQRLTRRRRPIDWGTTLIDTRGFKFDREEANARR